MPAASSQPAAIEGMLAFLVEHLRLMQMQLEGAEAHITETMTRLMDDLITLSNVTGSEKAHATQILEETYLTPNEETGEFVHSLQYAVDQILEQAKRQSREPSIVTENQSNQLRRFAAKFSKSMEALGSLDDDIKDLVLDLVGILSADDVVRQRLSHSIDICRLLIEEIESLAPESMTVEKIFSLKISILQRILSLYSTEGERVIFEKYFGAQVASLPPLKNKAS